MDLFDGTILTSRKSREEEAPLAWRMRPRSLEEFVGQRHLLGPGKLLDRAIASRRLSSVIFYGPPGCGKTAMAHLLAETLGRVFYAINAVTAGIPDVREILSRAQQDRRDGRRSLLFVDEIHRFNRPQQSALLPDVEDGAVTLIGASTENPFHAIIPALSSRSLIAEMKPLGREELFVLLDRALADRERGLGTFNVRMTEEARELLAGRSEGDARRMLNAIEIGVLTTAPGASGEIVFDRDIAETSLQKKAVIYDAAGDAHYDTISAFIKSIRGSDPDAAIYWLAKMIAAGEDPLFIARRLVILASEDIGNADPQALPLAVACRSAVEAVGMPEGRIPLAQATTYLSCAPKSNASYQALEAAMDDVQSGKVLEVPDAIRDAHYPGAARLGRGKGYVYPHDRPDEASSQRYLPEDRRYYHPTESGRERILKKRLQTMKGVPDEKRGGA